jgi:hypothetical protein
VATLTVVEPIIYNQPAGMDRQAGDTAILSATAIGTPPLTYQWWKDDVALAGATEPDLTLTHLAANDIGDYWMVVSNQFGTSTSRVAGLLSLA